MGSITGDVAAEDSLAGGWYAVGTAEMLHSQHVLEGLAGGRIVAVFEQGDRLYGIEANCAHQGGPLVKGCVADGIVTCPWHGWQYRLADGRNVANGQPMLEVFPVRIRDGIVEVMLAG